ncbi:MAG: hypothetical protein KBS95_04810 [Alistipes sp.]|nr:hypothetical protein [Candidatus Alistipes equi]
MVQYTSPQNRVVRIATRAHILNTSLDGSPSSNPWESGSESAIGFGDDDE